MRSFVKPSFAAKFGVATATSAAMVAAPLMALPASAATYTVTNCNATGEGSLVSAVEAAQSSDGADIVDFDISNNCTISLEDTLYISESITIDNESGYDVAVRQADGYGNVMFMTAYDEAIDVTIEGLEITGHENYTEDTRLISFAGFNARPSTFTLLESVVSYGEAGGIELGESVTGYIERSYIVHNTFGEYFDYHKVYPNGAGIKTTSDLNVSYSYFGYNARIVDYYSNGGAIFIEDADLTIKESTFTKNYSPYGGAIYARNSNIHFIGTEQTVFSSNGYSYYDLANGYLGGHAGAIDVHGSSTFIADSPVRFTGNISGDGGAIRFDLTQDSTVQFNNNAYFINNRAQDDGGAIRVRSGVYTQTIFEFNGTKTYFNNNAAEFVYAYTGDYTPNETGGAISVIEGYPFVPYLNPEDQKLALFEFNSAYTRFQGNYSAGDGGALFASNNLGYTIFDFVDEATPGLTYLSSNEADADGSVAAIQSGSVATSRSRIYVENATVSANTSRGDGTFYLLDASAYVYDSHFVSNSVSSDGGAFYLATDYSESYLKADGNEFYANTASGSGGVVFLKVGANASLENNLIVNNQAYIGSVLSMSSVNLYEPNYMYIFQNTIYDNYSTAPSAAITLGPAVYGRIGFNTFLNNTSPGSTLALSIDRYASDIATLNIFGNIFAAAGTTAVIETADSETVNDFGFNLLTGSAGQSLDGGSTTVSSYDAALRDGRSMLVTLEQLDLQTLAHNTTDPVNTGPLDTIALGADSVAIDFMPTTITNWNNWAPSEDMRGVLRFSGVITPYVVSPATDPAVIYGTGIDAGAFESINTFAPVDPEEPEEPGDDSSNSNPLTVITHVSKPAIQAAGDTIIVYGRGLNDVTKLYFNDTSVSFVKQADGSLLVTTPALPVGEVVITAYAADGTAVLQHAFWVVDTLEFSTWTRHVGDTIKIYAKNVIGRGKVQFFVDGKEIAWVNAVDATDPKLRTANGYHYLVRTVQLKADGSKTRFEVKLNGERVRRNTYTINSR